MEDFVLTEREVDINIWMSTAGSMVSLILCSTVLSLAYYVWSRPKVRSTLNRVSFRLLLWTMAFEIVYDISYMLVEFDTVFKLRDGLCASSVYFLIFSMTTVNYLCTSIAVNLMITLTFGLNPVKLSLEKYYVGGSVAFGALVPLVPAILGHFKNDPEWGVCWINADSTDELLLRLVLELYLWQILSCVIATAAVVTVLITLYRQGRATSAALLAGNQLNSSIFENDVEIGDARGRRAFLSRRARGGHKRDTMMGQLEDQFMRIALLVSCYPISLILVNGIITVGELSVTKLGGVTSTPVFALYCIYYALYGFRGAVFAALAFFIDPCFRRGLSAAWRTRHETDAPREEPAATRPDEEPKHSFAEMLSAPTPVLTYGSVPPITSAGSIEAQELAKSPFRTQTRSSDNSSVDLPLALGALAYGTHVGDPLSHPMTDNSTRSFVGVPAGHLPLDFTDELDIIKLRKESAVGSTLENLSPDLPDEEEEERLRRRASLARRRADDEQDQVDMEELMRMFLETKALL